MRKKHPRIFFTNDKEYGPVTCSSYDANGVFEIFRQKVAELPEEINVIAPYHTEVSDNAVFVAKDGKDTNAGTFKSPLATLDAALARIEGKGGQIYLREGSYTLTSPAAITAAMSGTDDVPTYIAACKGEKVILTAGIPLDATKACKVTDAVKVGTVSPSMLERLNCFDAHNADDIYVIDMFGLGYTAEDLGTVSSSGAPALYINGTSYHMARYPNAGQNDDANGIRVGEILTYGKDDEVVRVGQVSQYASSLLNDHKDDEPCWSITFDSALYRDRILAYKPYPENDPIWTHAEVYEEWWADTCAVTLEKDEQGRNVMVSQHNCSWGARKSNGTRIFFYNMPEELDEPTEYYIDRTTGLLYFKPESPIKDSDEIILTAKRVTLMEINKATNIVIDGIGFSKTVASGVSMTNCDYVMFQNCAFDNMGGDAITAKDSHYSGVINSEFVNRGINSTTVRLEADSEGLRKDTFYFVQNCRLDHAPLRLGGQRSIVSHNYFDACGISTVCTMENIIEYNEFYRGQQGAKDGGPIYNSGFGPKRGLHVRYNYFHDIDFTMHGIYFDDLSAGNYAYGNIVAYADTYRGDCATVHNGSMNVLYNNIFIHGGNGISRLLKGVSVGDSGTPELAEDLAFQIPGFLFSSEDLVFKLFEFRCDKPFRIDKGLFADIIFRHGTQVGFAHLDIVTENRIEFHLE